MTEQTLQRRVPADAGERDAAIATRRSGPRPERIALFALLVILAAFFRAWRMNHQNRAGRD